MGCPDGPLDSGLYSPPKTNMEHEDNFHLPNLHFLGYV